MTRISRILDADSYKASHFLQYPPGTEFVSSYIESRGGAFAQSLFFGLQIYLKDVLTQPITRADMDEAEEMLLEHGEPFNRAGWDHVLNAHGGHMPVRIEAVREGSMLPTGNALVQIVNTDPRVPWIVSYLETALLRAVWYPTTVATRSWHLKKIIDAAWRETSDAPQERLVFALHDFGARGASSSESASIGGLAHLVNFRGTDTLAALALARRVYREPMVGFSIPAAEHSTITSWGRERETDAYANMLRNFGGAGKVVAVVSDSYDVYHATAEIWGGSLASQVRETGGTLVVRPDSGDPTTTPVEIVEILAEKFGAGTNSKGFLVLPDYVRVIQGDGVDELSIAAILANLRAKGFAADNIAFGMGGGLLQKLDRDTLKFAMKTSAVRIGGEWIDVFKRPIGDPGKASKKGRLALVLRDGAPRTIRAEERREGEENLLDEVFVDGHLTRDERLEDIRRRSWR